MRKMLLAVLAFAPSLAFAQGGGTYSNAVGLWGQDINTGLPCVVAPSGGSATCRLPTGGSSTTVPAFTQPVGNTTTTSTAGAIASTGVYQSALAANTARKGCRIVNKGANPMRVFVGAPGSATDGTSFGLDAGVPATPKDGGSFDCGLAQGVVITEQISITGTAADAFLVVTQ